MSHADFKVTESMDGHVWLAIDHKDGPLEQMSIQAVTTYAETLGFNDAIDAVEAACTYTEEVGGEFPCEEQYLVIAEREIAREEEASKCASEKKAIADHDAAIRRGCSSEEARALAKKVPDTPDPRSPQLRGALAARKAVMDMTGCEKDSESVLVKSQREARRKVRACDPEKLPSVATRHQGLTCDVTPHSVEREDAKHFFDQEDREKLAAVLQPHQETLAKTRDQLLHVLSRRQGNPFVQDEEDPQRMMGVADLKRKYQA